MLNKAFSLPPPPPSRRLRFSTTTNQLTNQPERRIGAERLGFARNRRRAQHDQDVHTEEGDNDDALTFFYFIFV